MSAAKTWLITGAASGMGAALAAYALGQGHNVVGTARAPERLAHFAASHPDNFLGCRLDVTDPAEAESAVAEAVARFGVIDTLINNAGLAVVGALEETSNDSFRETMETNFYGVINVTRAILPHFRAHGVGTIVNISSIAALKPRAGFGAYAASKFALEGLSEALALEVAHLGIRVLLVELGAHRTDFAKRSLRFEPPLAAYEKPLGHLRAIIRNIDDRAQADPATAAEAIGALLASPDMPLRVQLGADAIAAARGKAAELLESVEHSENPRLFGRDPIELE